LSDGLLAFVSVVVGFICTAQLACVSSQTAKPQSQAPAAPQTISTANDLEAALSELTREIAANIEGTGKRKVAVVEFSTLDGSGTELGMYLAEELITRLFKTGKFEVVERQLLNKVLAEQELVVSGFVEPTVAQKLGKILGVDAIVSGTVADLGISVRINARIISTETGTVFAAAASETKKDEVVSRMLAHIYKTPPRPNAPEPPTESPKSDSSYVHGLRGEYFNMTSHDYNTWPDYPALTRVDRNVRFNWSSESPAPRINPKWFMVRWTGELCVPSTGIYTFRVAHDDGFRVLLNGKPVSVAWGGTPSAQDKETRADVALTAGWTPIRVDYFAEGKPNFIELYWSKPGDVEFEIIPADVFRTSK
jgi:TolB-like protein